MAAEQLPQAPHAFNADYLLTCLGELTHRVNDFAGYGRAFGFHPAYSFDSFEALGTEYLEALGSRIEEEQLIDATWHDNAGQPMHGSFVGLHYTFDQALGLDLQLQVVTRHGTMTPAIGNIAASQLVNLAKSQQTPPTRFTLVNKKPSVKPGQRVQEIIKHYTSVERVKFAPTAKP